MLFLETKRNWEGVMEGKDASWLQDRSQTSIFLFSLSKCVESPGAQMNSSTGNIMFKFHLLPGFDWLEARGMYARRSLSGKEGKKQERVWIPRYQDWILKAIAWKITTDIGDRLLRTNNRVQSRAGSRGWWGFLWGKFSWKLPPEWLLCFSWVAKTKLNKIITHL